MRLCVAHVYWMLLFTSVVSSALLFLIVASENIQNGKFIGPDRNQGFTQEENVSFIQESEDQHESDIERKSNIKLPSSLKPKIREEAFQDIQDPISASSDISYKYEESKIPKEIEILKESLTQQPNLSQGISDGGQAVVLTLVDTTAASLQNLASNRATVEFRGSDAGNVSSAPTSEPDNDDEPGDLVRISSLMEADSENATAANETSGYFEEDAVVVVRAEQKSAASIRDELEAEGERDREPEESDHDELVDELASQQLPKSPTTAPDLNDSAARAQLTGSADEGGAAAILDSLVTVGPSEPHEEIPSFNEWAQKRLEEAEKKKTHPNASVQTANGSPGRGVGNMRMRSKNYASPDCGAKVVAANPESRHARSILASTRDEYMLNTCTSRVWFVVELCEAIQAKKIELANFELFSSSPKDLSVYVSDRFPTRDWSNVGQFTARDERDVQSFSLHPHLFGKFIKVELHSHYGSEHFCPISLFRAYGTSEFEVLETETESDTSERRRETSAGDSIVAGSGIGSEDDEDEENVFEDEELNTNEPPGNLFGSARDAVLSIVKKAAEVLVKSDDLKPTNNITKIQESISGDVLEDETLDDCSTPVYNVACRDCDDDRFARVFQLISCKGHYLESLLNTAFMRETLTKSYLCSSGSGLDSSFYDSEACTNSGKAIENKNTGVSNYYLQAQFLSSLFTPDYIIALCNVLAAREQRLFANVSHQSQQQVDDETPNKTHTEQTTQMPLVTKDEKDTLTTRTIDVTATADSSKVKPEVPVIKSRLDSTTESQTQVENLATQIKPTKTIASTDESKKQTLSKETPKIHQSENINQHQAEIPSSTESPINTKRASTSSQKASTGPQEQASSSVHDSNSQRDIPTSPTSKISQHTKESSQRLNEKSTSSAESETDTKSEEEPEAKTKTKVDSVEQETKISAQDNLSFENFDFKDLDVDNLQNNGGFKGGDASVAQQTTTPQQKESVFLRLSNRIKALERNMSLSSQYLEELSRRYKKQVEEMQRSLERAMTAMSEESRKGEERETKRLEEVSALRGQLDTLTKVLDDLVYERNSWRITYSALIQHVLFVFIDVILVILILSYCRRNDDDLEYCEVEESQTERTVVVKPNRGTSYEIVKQTCNQLSKKPKKRRPSEIASQVSGTYDQLMIEDSMTMNQLSKRDRRKKRKKDSIIQRTSSIKETGSSSKYDANSHESMRGSSMPSRSASANDALYALNYNGDGITNLGTQRQSRPESAPDNSIAYFGEQQSQQKQMLHDTKIQILAMNESNEEPVKSEEVNNSENLNVSMTLEDDAFEQTEASTTSCIKPKKLSSPSFMKTALGSRSKRISFSGITGKKVAQSLDESMIEPEGRRFDSKMGSLSELETSNGAGDEHNNTGSANGHVEESDDSRSSSATPTSSGNKKEKKSNGLKKMVRRFF